MDPTPEPEKLVITAELAAMIKDRKLASEAARRRVWLRDLQRQIEELKAQAPNGK